MNKETPQNIDHTEREKFDAIASGWWDPEGPFRPLHDLNPARLKFVADRAELAGAVTVDVGCGGGILAESLAGKGGKLADGERIHGMFEGLGLPPARRAVRATIDMR